jgi:hypothetical protein
MSQFACDLKRGRPKRRIENTLNEPINYTGETNEPNKSSQASRSQKALQYAGNRYSQEQAGIKTLGADPAG